MKTKTINYKGVSYKCRVITDCVGDEITIGSWELLKALHPGPFLGKSFEDIGFTDQEAVKIYNSLFYFTNRQTLDLSDKDMITKLTEEYGTTI